MTGSAQFKESALINKSKKLQKRKSVVDRIKKSSEDDLAREHYNELEIEYEQNLVSTDRIYMIRVFPLFILFMGLFFIFVDVFFPNDTNMTLYIGISVTLIGIIWKITMHYVEKERKRKFLFGK